MPDTLPPLTDEQYAAIRQREAAATPGPWWNDSHEIYVGEHVGIPAMCTWIGETCNIDLPDRGDANGAFIAHAREDVPQLLDELDRLRSLLVDRDCRIELVQQHLAGLDSRTVHPDAIALGLDLLPLLDGVLHPSHHTDTARES